MIRAPIMMILESSTSGVKKAGLWVGVETVLNIGLSLALLQVLDAHGVILSTVIAVVSVSVLGSSRTASRWSR